jgi:hypothetical protein
VLWSAGRTCQRFGPSAAGFREAPAAVGGIRRRGDVTGPLQLRLHADGRVEFQILSALRADPLWEHPLVAEAFSPTLRVRLLSAARRRPDDFVLIDFAFWCRALTELDELCLPAYVRGLAAEGCAVPLETVRRMHALVMLLFAGVTAVPIELLFGGRPPGGVDVVRERAAAAAHVLDLVDATGA